MSGLAMDELFYGRPEPVTYVAGGVGYGSHEYGHGHQRGGHQGPHYYSDGDDYYSQRHSRAPLRHTSGAPMLPDVQLTVPMDSQRCVEKVKDALEIDGVYSVHCDVPNQTVTVSGNIAPQALLKRVKHVKRKSKILSYSSPYTSSVTSYGTSSYGSAYHRPARYTLSPPRDHSYYSRNNQHTFAHPVGYHDQRRPSHDHHYSNYY